MMEVEENSMAKLKIFTVLKHILSDKFKTT